jgi:hypothetical protein
MSHSMSSAALKATIAIGVLLALPVGEALASEDDAQAQGTAPAASTLSAAGSDHTGSTIHLPLEATAPAASIRDTGSNPLKFKSVLVRPETGAFRKTWLTIGTVRGGGEPAPAFSIERSRELFDRLDDDISGRHWLWRLGHDSGDREVLEDAGDPDPDTNWFHDHLSLTLRHGIVYRERLPFADQKLKLRLYGPVVKSKLGLGFELHGLHVYRHDVGLRAYGTAHKAGLTLRIEY